MIDRALHQGRGAPDPERRGRHGRHGAPDAHGRPRGLLRAAVPVRRGDAGHADRPLGLLRPARLRARRAGPRHATRTCAPRSSPAGPRIRRGIARRRAQHRPRADGGLPARRPGAASTARASCGATCSRTRAQLHAAVDHRAQRLPRPARADHASCSTGSTSRVGGARAAGDAVRRGGRRAAGAGAAAGRRRQRRRLAAQLGAARRPCRPSTWRTPGGSTPRAWATTSSTSASSACSPTRSGPTSRSSRPTSSRRPRARRPTGWTARPCSTSNGVRVGVIGATVRTTPELVRADATAGLLFLDEAERIRAESERLRAAGRRGAGRGHPRGRRARRQRGRRPPGGAVAGADRRHRRRRCRTRRSTW